MYEENGESLCPESSFYDGVCDAELMWITHATFGESPVSTSAQSWGSIKALYR
jgi:hypothetical protein